VIRATTRVAAVIGDPVRHSLSPVLHNAAYEALGLDWVYVAFEVPAGSAATAIGAARVLDLVGLSVTMPHKEAVAGACDELSADAAELRSVNTVTFLPDGRVRGDSTDGAGFVASLREAGCDPGGRAVLVLGAGGAARAVALALAREGATVHVAARRADAAAAVPAAAPVAWEEREAVARDVTLVVNATPIGMGGAEALPLVPVPGVVYADLVYHPLETPLLRAARAAGAETVDGLGMLVHQAALQVERWSGLVPPVAAMRAAAEAALAAG
jgi:shikimate dehydrogenase